MIFFSSWSVMSANSAVTLTSAGRASSGAPGQVVDAPEVVPPGVREVLVERHDAGVVRAGHDPATALLEQPDPDLAAELVVDMTADTERQVDLLRLEPGDLPAEELERGVVVGARHPEQLVVALVAAEHRVRQVEEDDRRLGEVGEPLVLETAARHQVARRRRGHDVVGVDRALGREVVGDRLVGQRFVADAGPPVPRRALPEALGGLVGVALGGVEPVVLGGPGGDERGGRPVGGDVAPVERLGRRPDAPSSRNRAPRAGTASGGRTRHRPRRR